MKIEITKEGKKVSGDYATVIRDLMFETTKFGTSKVGQTVSVQGNITTGEKIIIVIKGQDPVEGTVGRGGYLCISEEPRMLVADDSTGKKRVCNTDEVMIIYPVNPDDPATWIVGNEIFSLEELSFPAPRFVQ
ncbi:hypothetical protein PSA99_002919 [Escherichia coli]|nr:hypothetical protein [Escherichia coli]EMA0828033.1 hypothetical protein [Escherichia coli O157]EKL5716008.1 hypothetical protein [Escherichia coli]EKL5793559.1 hypothetical protein [Escherichia coli]EMA0833256.1 hypothetical protein [Escherichia coli]